MLKFWIKKRKTSYQQKHNMFKEKLNDKNFD